MASTLWQINFFLRSRLYAPGAIRVPFKGEVRREYAITLSDGDARA